MKKDLAKALLEHYSPQEGLSEIDPSHKGSGVDSTRNTSEHPISYFYHAGTQPESVVADRAKHKYTVKLPEHAKIYDIGTDPDKHVHSLFEASQKRPVNAGMVNNDEIHSHLKSKGYHGFTNSLHPDLPNVVGLYHKQKVEPMGKSEVIPQKAPDPMHHSDKIRSIADAYAKTKGISLAHAQPKLKVDPAHGAKIAEAYHNMKHDPNHPAVKASYHALINETGDQFKHLLNNGLRISKMKEGMQNPYPTSKHMLEDVRNNNHMWYYPTEQGFGSEGQAPSDHPMLQPTKFKHDGKPMLANDMFRVVHDYFGHAKEGHGFGPIGEENAWHNHKQMYTPAAHGALTAETRGQNSWVNFGPHGEANRANPKNTVYAEQKAGLMPDWTHSSERPLGKSELQKGSLQRRTPFNPLRDQPQAPQLNLIHDWQGGGYGSRLSREHIKRDEGVARDRFLHKLSARTSSRHSKDGGREFLLHRGMTGPILLPQGIDHNKYVSYDENSSWTPDHEVAKRFAYNTNTQQPDSLESAWIHENNILTMPNQYGNVPSGTATRGKNAFNTEHEVIVKPHPSEKADFKPIYIDEVNPDLNARITQRGQKGYGHFQEPKAVLNQRRMGKAEDEDYKNPQIARAIRLDHIIKNGKCKHCNLDLKDINGSCNKHIGSEDKEFRKPKPIRARDIQKSELEKDELKKSPMLLDPEGYEVHPDLNARITQRGQKGYAHFQEPKKVLENQRRMGKSLHKAIPLQDLQSQGYRLKVLPPNKTRDVYVMKAYHKGKPVGHMAYSTRAFSVPDTESMADRSHKNGYHNVFNSEIHPEHRGKGLYQHMINTGSEHVKGLGSKGLMSSGFQRSSDASRAWDKVAGHAVKDNPSFKPTPRNIDYFSKSLSEALFETLSKGENHKLCAMFAFEDMEDADRLDIAHVTHKYFSDYNEVEKVIELLEAYFKEHPFKKFTPKFDKVEWFGEDKDIKVLRPENEKPFLFDLKEQLDQLTPDKFPVYKPHTSVSSNVEKIELPITNYILISGGKILWKAIDNDLNKSELEKGRPVLNFPHLNLKANPNQDIRSVSTPRQKEIAARSQINAMAPKNMHPVSRQKSVDRLYDQIGSARGGFSTIKTADPEKNKNQKGMGWANQGALTVKRDKGIPYKQLTPQGKMYQDKITEAAKVHESHHKLYHDLKQKIGEAPTKNLLASFANNLNPETKNHLINYLHRKGYGPDSTDNEEIVNHIRDLISMPSERQQFHESTGIKDPQKQRDTETHLKQAWNKIYQKAKNFKFS